MNTLNERYMNLIDIVLNDNSVDETKRESFVKTLSYAKSQGLGFFKAPASTKYHLSRESGLLEHSINVAEIALKIKNAVAPELSDSSVVICSLLHDLGKSDEYIQKEPTEKQKNAGYPGSYSYNDNIVYMEHEHRSLYYCMLNGLVLSDEEFGAICYHNSPWNGITRPAFRKNKLMTILENADYWSTVYLENGGK